MITSKDQTQARATEIYTKRRSCLLGRQLPVEMQLQRNLIPAQFERRVPDLHRKAMQPEAINTRLSVPRNAHVVGTPDRESIS
jgi:hypothetical protein